jgi:hypothetical protein
MSDLFRRPLKKAGSRAIEDALKKAICDLTGEKYDVDIVTIDFGNDGISSTNDTVKINLTASKVFEMHFKSVIGGDEDTASPTSS